MGGGDGSVKEGVGDGSRQGFGGQPTSVPHLMSVQFLRDVLKDVVSSVCQLVLRGLDACLRVLRPG